jgi:CheY-like chemotaxis protein
MTARRSLRVLIAEDEETIAQSHELILRSRSHQVTMTKDGKSCVEQYVAELEAIEQDFAAGDALHKTLIAHKQRTPFDVVILDYRMPIMDGVEAAKKILALVPEQRIIFASAYLRGTLLDSIRQLNRVTELLTKPFALDELVEVVEDQHLYKQLQKLNVNVQELKSFNPTHSQIFDLLEGLVKLRNLDVDYLTKSLLGHKVNSVQDRDFA